MSRIQPGNLAKIHRGSLWGLLVISMMIGSFGLAIRHLSHSISGDEALTAGVAGQNSYPQIIRHAVQTRPHLPLYFLAVHESLKFRSDEIGLRIPSALFGSLAIGAVFLLGRTLAGNGIGMLSSLLFFLTPRSFFYFTYASPYTLWVLLSTLSTYYLYQGLQLDRTKDWLRYALFTPLSLGAHLLSIFYLLAQLAAAFLLRGFWKSSPLRVGTRSSIYKKLFFLTMPFFALWLFWVIFYFRSQGFYQPPVLSRVFSIKTLFFFGHFYLSFFLGGMKTEWTARLSLALISILAFMGTVRYGNQEKEKISFVGAMTLVYLVTVTCFVRAVTEDRFIASRYCLVLFPFLCILSAASLGSWNFRLGRKFASLIFVIYLLVGFHIIESSKNLYETQDWKSSGRFLKSHVAMNDFIIICPEDNSDALEYYYNISRHPLLIQESEHGIAPKVRDFFKNGERERNAWFVASTHAVNRDHPLSLETLSRQILDGLKTHFNVEVVERRAFKGILIQKLVLHLKRNSGIKGQR